MSLDNSSVALNFTEEKFEALSSEDLTSAHNGTETFGHSMRRHIAPTQDELLIRAFDLTVSVVVLFALLPVLAIIFLLVKASSAGPAIFVQQRVGKGGQSFPCLKFRTMVKNAEERLQLLLTESEAARIEWSNDQKLRNDPRITAIGQFLRKTSLDELPQIFNIVAGHMSIVGPRPIVTSEIVKYGKDFITYCEVRPGLTGLWQISGRNDTTYSERVALDVRYVRLRNLKFNLEICIKTVPALFFARGCY